MIGHSMGGLLSSRFAQRYPDDLAGIVLLGAVIGDWNWARKALEQPELPQGATDFSGMSRDEAAVQAYATDPLIYRGPYLRPLLEAEIVALDRFQANIDALTMPVLFCHGTEDPFVDYRTSLAAVESMPSDDKANSERHGTRVFLEPILREVDLPTDLADALDDTFWDDEIRADGDEALALTGKDVGTPIIHFEPPNGVAFFGPVMSRLPEPDQAGVLWDHVVGLARFPGFAELKRSLREKPQLVGLGVEPGTVGTQEDWHGGSRRQRSERG